MATEGVTTGRGLDKPVLYLDVDDTLIDWGRMEPRPAFNAEAVLREARVLTEIRWLTWWAPTGVMPPESVAKLAKLLNIDEWIIQPIRNPRKFMQNKCDGIDFADPRPWFWIEDGLLDAERAELRQRGKLDRFYPANVTRYHDALWKVWATRIRPQLGIFVFGSNEAGVHGAGAAREACDHYGALWGHGVGRCGQSYAIPTKDGAIKTLSLPTIGAYVHDFLSYAKDNPHQWFFLTRVGCGLAGYTDEQIAPLFAAGLPYNVMVERAWQPWFPHHHQWTATPDTFSGGPSGT